MAFRSFVMAFHRFFMVFHRFRSPILLVNSLFSERIASSTRCFKKSTHRFVKGEGKSLKELWCCRVGEYKVDNVNW